MPNTTTRSCKYLQGEQGLPGENSTVAGPEGPQGVQGLPGENGVDGSDGLDGYTWYDGIGAPASETGVDGDYYLRTSNSDVYNKITGIWTIILNIKGLTGEQGIQGEEGPTGEQGLTGDAGAAGADGKTVLNGVGAPDGGLGALGDFYIDTTSNSVYGPKTGGGWGIPTSLIGPDGDQGIQGDPGEAGAAGSPGPNTITTATSTDFSAGVILKSDGDSVVAATSGSDFLSSGDVDDTPNDGDTADAASSNWAYDHSAAADPHTGYMKESVFDADSDSIIEGAQIQLTTDSDSSITGLLKGSAGNLVAATAGTDYSAVIGQMVGHVFVSKALTNIGNTYVDVYATAFDEEDMMVIDFTGASSFRVVYMWDYVGAGTQSIRWVNADDNTKVLLEVASVVADADAVASGWISIPNDFTNVIKTIEWQGKSTTSGDDPIAKGYCLYLR